MCDTLPKGSLTTVCCPVLWQVLYERNGDMICHVKFTVLLLPGGTSKVTGLPLPEGQFVSEGKVRVYPVNVLLYHTVY